MPVSLVIAVITFQRPQLLAQLLESLQRQQPATTGGWNARIVVVDNDPAGSAEGVVRAASDQPGGWPISYLVEPEPGIPAARQSSVDQLQPTDDALVFVDDDEIAPAGWLDRLVSTWLASGADVVTGPVEGLLPEGAPDWARRSDTYSSVGRHRSGTSLDRAYTNNTLVARQVLEQVQPAFDQTFRFSGSSDLHFFQRVARAGFRIIWDDEAVVQEHVPAERLELAWFLRRAFRSGAGDSISRSLMAPGWRGRLVSAGYAAARCANGAALLAGGVVKPELRIKGLRRMVSGVGSFAGLVGINHQEYRR